MLIVSGRLDLDNGIDRMSVDTSDTVILVDPDTCADLLKTPGGEEQRFRSIFLSFSAELLDRFHRDQSRPQVTMRTDPPRSALQPQTDSPSTAPFRGISLDHDLQAVLRQALDSIEAPSLSDERLAYRLLDLLQALAERGQRFGQADLDSIAGRVRLLISEAPERSWTAQETGKALAMSPATLRRRLAGEQASFEDLLIDVRMHHAMMLVQTTAWDIARIAEACGYKSRARFSERFQARFGYLPSSVR